MTEHAREQPSEEEIREIAGLADGSLPPERRAAAQARVDASPELRELLAEQRRAVETVRAASASVAAPSGLRTSIQAQQRALAPTRRRRHLTLGLGFTGAVAAAALVVFLVIPPGTPRAPSVVEAAALTDEPAEEPAPGPARGNSALLDATADGLPYPNWGGPDLKWPATGARDDELGDRDATTVFYEREGRRLGYTIVSGDALKPPKGSRRTVYEGVVFHEFRQGGQLVVTWERNGRTCVMSGEDGIKREALLGLGAWDGQGKVPF
jgi:hypothetical protein